MTLPGLFGRGQLRNCKVASASNTSLLRSISQRCRCLEPPALRSPELHPQLFLQGGSCPFTVWNLFHSKPRGDGTVLATALRPVKES